MTWSHVALADCCDIVSGATPRTTVEAYWDGDIDWVTPKDLSDLDGAYIHQTPRRITKAGLASCGANVLPPQSVLFSSRAPIGHVAINSVPMATNQGFKSLIPRANRVDAKYLFHWLKANRSYLESLGNGATFKEVSKAIVARVQIPLPPVDEQRRIAAILDRADALRTKRRQALVHLDHLTQSIFLDMFGDPASNPKGFRRVVLGDVVHSASDGPHVSPKYADSGIPFISTRHVKPGRIDWRDLKYLSADDAAVQWRKCRPSVGDILYTKGGTTGVAAAVTDNRPFAVWVHVAVLKPITPIVDSRWLESMLNSQFCYVQSQRLTHGIANHDLGLKRMVKIEMYLPPLEDQTEFAHRVSRVSELLELNTMQSEGVDHLFSSLQSRAFAGEL